MTLTSEVFCALLDIGFLHDRDHGTAFLGAQDTQRRRDTGLAVRMHLIRGFEVDRELAPSVTALLRAVRPHRTAQRFCWIADSRSA